MAWQVIESEAERGEEVRTFWNVVPAFGPAHDMHPHCWCEPGIDHERDDLVVHREIH